MTLIYKTLFCKVVGCVSKIFLRFLVLAYFVVLGFGIFTDVVSAEERVYYVHSDHLGSTTLISSESGVLVSQQNYYPYGATRAIGKDLPTERQYTGQVSDQDQTGLYYYNARYYDPQLAKFTQADTANDGLNRYAYVSGNPINHSDPSGHCKGIGCWFEEQWKKLRQSLEEANQEAFGDVNVTNVYAPWASPDPAIRDAYIQGTTAGIKAVGGTAAEIAIYAAVASFAGPEAAETVDVALCAVSMDPGMCMTLAQAAGPNLADNAVHQFDDVVEQVDELGEITATSGVFLDVGGGRNTSYSFQESAITVNIDSATKPHVMADARALPFGSGSVGSWNASNLPAELLLEENLWSESARVTAPGNPVFYRADGFPVFFEDAPGKFIPNRGLGYMMRSGGLENVSWWWRDPKWNDWYNAYGTPMQETNFLGYAPK